MAVVIVERDFAEPETFEAINARGDRGTWCYELYGIRFAGAYFAADGRRMICTYEAPDAESVRMAQRRVDLPAIGPETVRRAAETRLAGIAVAASDVLIAERDTVIALADEAGLFVVGIEPLDAAP